LERHQLDAYARMLELSWPRLIPLLFLIWVWIAAVFALAYFFDPGAVAGARPGSFADAFFFSVQTLSTIGYGVLSPRTPMAHLLVTLESFLGLLAVALMAGLAFAKFSRPSARVLFSRYAVIGRRDGVPSLLLRMANARHSAIAEAHVRLALARDEVTVEGEEIRRFHELVLVRDWTPLFALTWTIVHRIDESSPLFGATRESLAAQDAQLLVSVVGIELAFHQTVHARGTWSTDEIAWNARFGDVLVAGRGPSGYRVDYTHFHETLPLESS
jgi:inward rectifier potassium channel